MHTGARHTDAHRGTSHIYTQEHVTQMHTGAPHTDTHKSKSHRYTQGHVTQMHTWAHHTDAHRGTSHRCTQEQVTHMHTGARHTDTRASHTDAHRGTSHRRTQAYARMPVTKLASTSGIQTSLAPEKPDTFYSPSHGRPCFTCGTGMFPKNSSSQGRPCHSMALASFRRTVQAKGPCGTGLFPKIMYAMQSNPIQSNPNQSNLNQFNPTQSKSIQSNPIQSNPIPSNPIQRSCACHARHLLQAYPLALLEHQHTFKIKSRNTSAHTRMLALRESISACSVVAVSSCSSRAVRPLMAGCTHDHEGVVQLQWQCKNGGTWAMLKPPLLPWHRKCKFAQSCRGAGCRGAEGQSAKV